MIDPRYLAYKGLYPECCNRVVLTELRRSLIPENTANDPLVLLVIQSTWDYIRKEVGLEIPSSIFDVTISTDQNLFLENFTHSVGGSVFNFGILQDRSVANSDFSNTQYYVIGDNLVTSDGRVLAHKPAIYTGEVY